MFDPGAADAVRARRLLQRYGDGLTFDLLDHKRGRPAAARDRPTTRRSSSGCARFRAVVERGALEPAPPARPRGRRRRPDRARLPARARASGARCERCSTRSSTTRRCNTREHAARAGEGAARVIRWDAPGYVVAFTTRVGGVSERRVRVAQPRPAAPATTRRASRRTAGSPARRSASTRAARVQPPGALADACTAPQAGHARRAGRRALDRRAAAAAARDVGRLPADRDRAARTARRALAVAPRGLARARRGRGRARACARSATARGARSIGPAIGPCCYEVGPEVVGALRRRPDAQTGSSTSGPRAERALRAAGVEHVDRVDLCTRDYPELFFSHRRDGARRAASRE